MALHLASILRGSVRFAALIGLGAAALSLSACGDDSAGTGGGDSAAASTGTGECAGVVEDGACVAKCDPTQCTPGNICAGNRCTLPCDGVTDCYAGTTCQDTIDDATGAAAKACLPSGKAAILGANCYFGNECDAWAVCPDGTACGASVCGGQACVNNLCPDGTACTPQTCDPTACRAPRCYGAAPEPGQSPSATSFCTQDDCTQDADCVQGMYCAKTRDWHAVCGREDDFGGIRVAEGDCVDPAEFTTNGKTFELGTITLLRNTCLPRTQCSPCETDLDCSAKPGQVCGSVAGENRCVSQCTQAADCGSDTECSDDPAHAGMKVCAPRFGSCTGDGSFCASCLDDLDCGEPDSPMVCDPVSILYDAVAPSTPSTSIPAQRGCFDLSLPDECESNGDCPVSPGGIRRGECLGSEQGFSSGDGFFEHCFVPYNAQSYRFSCW